MNRFKQLWNYGVKVFGLYEFLGEVSAAIRVLQDLRLSNHRYCDIFCADALYAQAPFINAAVSQGMDVLVKVKQDNYHLVRDMDELMAREPACVFRGVTPKDEPIENNQGVTYDIELWDAEGFTSWEQVDYPLSPFSAVGAYRIDRYRTEGMECDHP